MVPATSSELESVEAMVDAADLSEALNSDRFKRFLDHVPVAIAVSELREPELIIYVNLEFERMLGLAAGDIENDAWDILSGASLEGPDGLTLASAIVENTTSAGMFRIKARDQHVDVELYANIVENDAGRPTHRLVALVEARSAVDPQSLVARVREKDTQLRELQHRVKNNLQMITALIRLESRSADTLDKDSFARLAGRVASLAVLYDTLALSEDDSAIDLGVYLSQIASAVMASHAVEGISLDLRVDPFPVSINVAMPTGLVVNELLTNSLKHAFVGRESGRITLHSVVDEGACTVKVADDGIGFPPGETWPKPGRLGALVAESLRQDARAHFEVASSQGTGTTVTISFRQPA